MTTAFFGGSFDPPHRGHLAVAKGALASGVCDHVMWVPAFAPPHKLNFQRAPFELRMEMVSMLISGEHAMSVSDIERRISKTPSYTIDILEFIEAEQGIRPALLIGADSLKELHTWHRSRELAENYAIYCYPRKNYSVSPEVLKDFWGDKMTEKLLSGIIPGKFFEISSTKIRNSMEKSPLTGNIKGETDLPDEMTDFIKAHNLYGTTNENE